MKEVAIDKENKVTVDIDSIERIDIERITDVVSHRIAKEGDLVVHELEFSDHGYCKAAYAEGERLIEFISQNMSCTMTADNVLVLRKSRDSD